MKGLAYSRITESISAGKCNPCWQRLRAASSDGDLMVELREIWLYLF